MPRGLGQSPRIELSFDSELTNAAVARREVGSFARDQGVDEETVQAARAVVTEAFTNAASHAYAGGSGRIDVTAAVGADGLSISVRDYGEGIRPSPLAGEGHGRLGLLMIAALAELCQIRKMDPAGTELTAVIALPHAPGVRAAGERSGRSLVA